MSWLDVVGGLFRGTKDVAEVFKENKENRGQRRHEQQMADVDRDLAVLAQYAVEFQSQSKPSWWESFVNGLNRLPRPILAIAVLGFFVLAPLNPTKFLEIAKAYEMMPAGYWALLSIIIGFYFGGRMQLKSQDFAIKKNAVKAARELMEMKTMFRQLDQEEAPENLIFEAAVSGPEGRPQNRVVTRWLEAQPSA